MSEGETQQRLQALEADEDLAAMTSSSTPRNRGHAAASVGGALARLRRTVRTRPTSSV